MATRQVRADLILAAQDRTARAFSSVSGRLAAVEKRSKRLNQENGRTARTMLAVGRAAAVCSAAAVAVGGAAYRNFAGDERTLTRIGITAEATREEMQAVRNTLFSISKDTGLQFEDSVVGLDALTASGRNLNEAMALLPSIMATAQASGANVDDIATSADALFTSLNINASDMQGAFDILVAGGKAGKFELKDMAQHLPSLAPAFKALGYEGEAGLRKLIVALQTVRTQTGSSGEAATAFTDVLTKMESQTITNNFKKFGVDLRGSLSTARKNGEDVLDTFIKLSQQAVKGDLSKLPQLFTDKQMLIGMRSLITSADAMEKFNAALQNTDGATLKDLGVILDDQQAKIDKMSVSFDRFMGNIGAGVAGPLGSLFDSANDKMDLSSAISRGLEGNDDYSSIEKYLHAAYPNLKDENIRKAAIKGGYQFEKFEGGASATGNIPIPRSAPLGGVAQAPASGLKAPVFRGKYDPREDPVYKAQAPVLALENTNRISKTLADEDAAFAQTRSGERFIAPPQLTGTYSGSDFNKNFDIDTGQADAKIDAFSAKAEAPMKASLDLDTSAAEAKLSALEKRSARLGSAAARNRGRSMPDLAK